MDGVIKPRGNLVLVEALPKEDTVTKGGIALPPAVVEEGITYAIVRDMGPGRYLENGQRGKLDDLKRGDTVIVKAKQMMPINVDDTKVGLINEQDILAVVVR